MFKSVKKAISGLFGARVVAKPRRNVIALPTVDTAAESEAALVDARRGLLATLEEILQGKKDAEEEAIDSILDLLHEGFCDGEYRTAELNNKLSALLRCDVLIFDNDGWSALAAAIEYCAGCFPVDAQTIEFASRLVASGEYIHLPEVDDDWNLGEYYAFAVKRIDCEDICFLQDYFDFERCGEDYRSNTHGKFTRYGFFAEL